MADFFGSGGDDTQVGSAGEDSFDFSQGGSDTLFGGDDDDSFIMGATLDPGDVIDGGDQINLDSVEIGGDYSAGLTITSSMLQGIEGLGLDAGDYRLTLGDGVANGYFVVGMQPGCTGVFDASAVTANSLNFGINDGVVMRIIGGAGDDRFEQYSADRKNVLIGGPGQDELTVQYVTDFKAAGHSFSGFETLRAVTAHRITLADGNVAAGETLTVDAWSVLAMNVDGHRERDGHFVINGDAEADLMAGGQLGDTLSGGGADDTITGAGGADTLTGGAGADTFAYGFVHQSWSGAADLITDLEAGDVIDLSGVDADRRSPGDQAFTVVAAFDHNAGELTMTYDAGQDLTTIAGDVNGDGRADLVIHLSGDQTGFAGIVL
jgi:Ca2+-binding RTX toxin-like protein